MSLINFSIPLAFWYNIIIHFMCFMHKSVCHYDSFKLNVKTVGVDNNIVSEVDAKKRSYPSISSLISYYFFLSLLLFLNTLITLTFILIPSPFSVSHTDFQTNKPRLWWSKVLKWKEMMQSPTTRKQKLIQVHRSGQSRRLSCSSVREF